MKENIVALIKNNIDVYYIQIDDLTKNHKNHTTYDGGGHYKAIIVSNDFKKTSLLKRHQMVYAILNKMIKKQIHALSLKTLSHSLKTKFDVIKMDPFSSRSLINWNKS